MAELSEQVADLKAAIFDEPGTKRLAAALLRGLLSVDDTTALNAAVLAIAAFTAEPEITKANAIELAVSFGNLVAEEIETQWDALREVRARADAEIV